jgi:hypothetical protein
MCIRSIEGEGHIHVYFRNIESEGVIYMCIRSIESEGSYTCVDPSLSILLIHMYMTHHFLYS